MEDNFDKKDDLYDPNFSIENNNNEKLDMYGVWLKNKKPTSEPVDADIQQLDNTSNEHSDFDDAFSFSEEFNEDTVLELDELGSLHEDDSQESEAILQEDSFETLDLDDFLDDVPTEDSHKAQNDEPLKEENMDDLDISSPNKSAASAELEDFTEISLDDFEDSMLLHKESLDELETIEEFDNISTETEHKAVNKIPQAFDISVTADDEAGQIQHFEDLSSQNEEHDIPLFDTDTAATVQTESSTESMDFDDVEALEQDLLSEPAPLESSEQLVKRNIKETGNRTSQDKTTELLIKIAHEISDLKAELNDLKAGIAAQSSIGQPSGAAALQGQQEQESASVPHTQSGSSGFFSDDDTDETISLTGDELNNILITADFTEEKNAEDDDTEEYDIPKTLTEDIIVEAEENTEELLEDIAEPEEDMLTADPAFNIKPAPITSMQDDLSYLDDDTIHENDAVIPDEPEQLEEELLEPIDEEIISFDIPQKQEIEVPYEEVTQKDMEECGCMEDEKHTIHELATDENHKDDPDQALDILELEADDDIIEEPFIEGTSALTIEKDADTVSEIKSEEDKTNRKQETLLQAATQIIHNTQEKHVSIPLELKNEIKSVLAYMDQLLEALPEKKIEEFAKSEYFETYKHLFEELGIS